MSPACCLPPAAAAPRRASGLVASTNSWPSSDQGSTKDSRARSRALATTSDSRHGCSQRARPWRGRLPSCGWPRIYRPAVWRWCPTLQQCGPLLRHRHSPGGLGHAAAMRPGWPAHGSTRRVSWVSAPMTSSRHSEPPPMSRPNGGPPPRSRCPASTARSRGRRPPTPGRQTTGSSSRRRHCPTGPAKRCASQSPAARRASTCGCAKLWPWSASARGRLDAQGPRRAQKVAAIGARPLQGFPFPPPAARCVPLGVGAVSPAFGPVPAHQLAEAVDAAAEHSTRT